MQTIKALLLASALQLAVFCSSAAPAKTYQVTGPVLELTDKLIVVQKNDERWEIERDAGTRIDGKLKVGDKVTIHYRMTATSIEKKPGEGKAKAKGKTE
jgi:hypothetical protein